MIIECRDICKSYGQEIILNNISFGINPGESVAVTGDSGRGKSTLLSVMGLLLNPDSGAVYFNGSNITELDDRKKSEIRNRNFGFVFQHTQLVGSVTVLDNVMIPALFSRDRKAEGRAREILDELGLSNRIYHYPYQLSIGQKRRVSLARALIMDPDVVFADEPTNDLDCENATIVSRYLFKCTEEGKGLVIVTHDRNLAWKAGNRLEL